LQRTGSARSARRAGFHVGLQPLFRSETLKRRAWQLACLAAVAATTAPVLAHDCRVLGNGYLRGSYEGDCEEKNELAQGQGEAKGADAYVGSFVKGRPDGKGTYTWENGGRLEGTFKAGKADGPGVYVSPKGARYEGPFGRGKLNGAKPEDCPATQGPLNC
jgi:hypothetical protein